MMRSTMRFLPGSLLVTVAAVVVLTFAGPVALANSTPGTLTFTLQPTTSQVGTVMSVVVEDLDSSGTPISSFNGQVALTYAFNRLGAPLPQGSTATARKGIARFSLTFGAEGFGFTLQASARGVTTSNASDAFDIVDQLLQCPSDQSCQSQTVSSKGTSGFAAAATGPLSDVLAATGGGFPRLSCTNDTLGDGVVTFTATNRSKTVTIMLAKNLVQMGPGPGSSHFNICWGSDHSFPTAPGTPQATQNPANDNEWEGLLPNCPNPVPVLVSSPCIASQNKTNAGMEVTTVSTPPGDGRGTY